MANDTDDVTARWYGGLKADAPKSDADEWIFVQNSEGAGGFWTKAGPVIIDGFIFNRQRPAKP